MKSQPERPAGAKNREITSQSLTSLRRIPTGRMFLQSQRELCPRADLIPLVIHVKIHQVTPLVESEEGSKLRIIHIGVDTQRVEVIGQV